MKTIFLANNKGNIDYVYSKAQQAELSAITDIETGTVYSQEDILAAPEKFSDVEYIFSTWSMPGSDTDDFSVYMPNLKAVFFAAGTVKYFAKPYLEKGIRIFSSFAANAIPVAEYTVAQIILANKGFYAAQDAYERLPWDDARNLCAKRRGNYGVNVGIIGAGAIGRLVIGLLKPYKLNVFVFDKFLSDEAASALGVEKCSLEELFENCSVISNHLANVPETVGILDYSLFSRMGEYATFINTGRGAQVVEADLVRALTEKPEAYALLDVTEPEPPAADSPLRAMKNIILTPHIAGSFGDEVNRLAEYAIDSYKKFTRGEKSDGEVTLAMLAHMA